MRTLLCRRTAWLLWGWLLVPITGLPSSAYSQDGVPASASSSAPPASGESSFLHNVRQLTFEGRRSGEGYFSADGSRFVFQSERDPGNPFFQIYLLEMETGDIQRISPGTGKTTCAWISPTQSRIMFASTHLDPTSSQKQQEELAARGAGKERRYAWDYDPAFELFTYDLQQKSYQRLTDALGYDAEGAYSPDGNWIVFSSNRHAYRDKLTPSEQTLFAQDLSALNEIYLMRSDGTEVRRLTHSLGYDGGPFFSPDGRRICWRRFAENGATAEIMTMHVDGSDVRQITRLGAMSWAPFYHPSGQYLIFATNRHGFNNFELYLVDAAGERSPVRVTTTEGFDGLPTFSPDGRKLAWTSNRTTNQQSQIFIADWSHEYALTQLGLTDHASPESAVSSDSRETPNAAGRPLDPSEIARDSMRVSDSEFLPQDLLRHVDFLCRPELAGRMTGSAGENLATSYVAAVFDHLGLEPAGDQGTWYQEFQFTAGVDLGEGNVLQASDGSPPYELNTDWRPLSFSRTGTVPESQVVFAGYGIVAPAGDKTTAAPTATSAARSIPATANGAKQEGSATSTSGTGDQDEYDSYVHLDVKDKWVLVFRFLPEQISAERRQHLSGHASLRYKAMVARDLGARGLIVVSGPTSRVEQQLIPLAIDGTFSGTSIPVLSITDAMAQRWFESVDKDLGELQRKLDDGTPQMGFPLDVNLTANIEIRRIQQKGRNVLGRLPAEPSPDGLPEAKHEFVVVGAHVDHLGQGTSASSLAREDEKGGIHFGADDNASGIAAMLEVAQYLADQRKKGKLPQRRDVVFAAWSGEELGLIGSSHFASQSAPPGEPNASSLHRQIAACLNMDMVGRFENKLVLQGVGSSSIWRGEIEQRNAPIGLPIALQNDSYLPTDASTFFMRGVPILSAFTGSHSDYHTPRDTPEKLNYDAGAKIAQLMGAIARSLVLRETAPDYIPQAGPEKSAPRARLRAYLGTIPDYTEGDTSGLKLSGVAQGGPAAQGGLRGGDVIVQLAGKKIENIYDYTYAIEALKIGEPIQIVVLRGEQKLTLQVTPSSRD